MRDSESKAASAVSKSLRNYPGTRRDTVEDFYRLNHQFQTYDFARARRQEYGQLDHARMDVWQACEKLNEVVDDSVPDTDLTQLEHLLQTELHSSNTKYVHVRWRFD